MVFGILRQSKESVMNGGDYGEDEDSFIKAMELEIDTYSVIVQEISATVFVRSWLRDWSLWMRTWAQDVKEV